MPEPALPRTCPAMPDPVALAAGHLWGFLTALRAAGVTTALTKQADLLRAIGESPPPDLTALYWYARITLLHDVTTCPRSTGSSTPGSGRAAPDRRPAARSGRATCPPPQGPARTTPRPATCCPATASRPAR